MNIKVKQNYIWGMLDEGSQLFIINLLMEKGFKGEVSVIGKPNVKDDGSVAVEIHITDEEENNLTLPINILDILNG